MNEENAAPLRKFRVRDIRDLMIGRCDQSTVDHFLKSAQKARAN